MEVGSNIHLPHAHFTTTIGCFMGPVLGRIGLVVALAPESVNNIKFDKDKYVGMFSYKYIVSAVLTTCWYHTRLNFEEI